MEINRNSDHPSQLFFYPKALSPRHCCCESLFRALSTQPADMCSFALTTNLAGSSG